MGSPNFDPSLLGSTTTVVASDGDGLASIAPWAAPVTAGEQVNGLATIDSGGQVAFFLEVLAALNVGGAAKGAATGGASVSHLAFNRRSGGLFPGFTTVFGELFPVAVWKQEGSDGFLDEEESDPSTRQEKSEPVQGRCAAKKVEEVGPRQECGDSSLRLE